MVVFIEMYPYFFIIYLCWMDTWRVLFGCNTAAMKVDSWQSEELKAEKSESETTLNFLWIWITCSATQGGVVDQHYLVSTLNSSCSPKIPNAQITDGTHKSTTQLAPKIYPNIPGLSYTNKSIEIHNESAI